MERTRKYVIGFFAFLMVLGMVVAGVYTRPGSVIANPFKSKEVLAKVGSDEVTVADYTLLKKKIESQFGGQFSLAQIGMTSDRILDQAVNSRISVQEAKRLGFNASDREVSETVVKQFNITSTDEEKRAREYIVRNYGGIDLYWESVRDALASEKLRAFVSAGAQVSETEVRESYARENVEFDVAYVAVTAEDVAKKITASDEELRQYFDAHKTDYRFLEPQKKIRYVFLNQEKVGQKLAIPDEDLRKEYDALKPENKMAGVRVQQIVLKVARPELDQEILNKATAIVSRIRKEDLTASEEEFAEQARGNSEDPATVKEGGWLPNPVKRNPNRKPNSSAAPGNVAELLQNTLEWKEGQVGDPLRTGNAYYIFRRGAVVPKTFEDAKQELLVSLRNRRSYAVAQEIARKANDRLKETRDPQKVAQEFAAQANMTPAEMVRETGFIQPGDAVPEIGTSPQFEERLKPLEEAGAVGEFVGVKNGLAIPQLVEKRDPRIPDLDEVKDRVAEDLKRSRAAEQLEQAAKELAAAGGGVDALKAAATKAGLKAEDEEAFKLGRPLGTAGADPALDAAVYQLKTGEGTKAPVKVGDKWVVVAVKERRDSKPEVFEQQKAELTERALEERRGQLFDDFLVEARRKLEEKGQIEINRDSLALLDEEEPAAMPRRPPISLPPPATK
jgi:peptidyl-prolyl cis-trans isomerase D